jgi:hypothetical protein
MTSVERWSEVKASLLDSLPTLGYSGRQVPHPGLLALCFGDISEII